MSASVQTCIGEPVSWLRLESMALGERDVAAVAHLDACAACRACMEAIRVDVVALPPLRVPERRPARAWLRWAFPAFGVVAAAAIALLVVRPSAPRDERVATVKGAGEVVIDLVRDREGAIGMGATTFRAGDRWKVVVTCAPGAATWVDVAVVEQGAPVAVGPDYPLAPVRVACGNRVVVPGAFVLTGGRTNRVCAVMAADAAPARDGGDVPSGEGVACVMVRPEKP